MNETAAIIAVGAYIVLHMTLTGKNASIGLWIFGYLCEIGAIIISTYTVSNILKVIGAS